MTDIVFAIHAMWHAIVEDGIVLLLFVAAIVAVRLTVNRLSR